MNMDSLKADLLALAQTAPDDSTRPKAARLRAVLPAVEAALAAGTSREKVLETLRAHGLDMTLAVFNTTLRRVREGHKMTGDPVANKTLPLPAPALTTPVLLAKRPLPYLHDPSQPVDMDYLINLGKEKAKK